MDRKTNTDVPVDEIFDKAESELYKNTQQKDFQFLYEAVNALDKKQRTVVVLFYFNDMPINEIAKATGSLKSTVKSQLFLARKKMKKYIQTAEGKGRLIANEI